MPDAMRSLLRPLLEFDPLHPMGYLTSWYDQFVKHVRWVGAVAAAMLVFSIPMFVGNASAGAGGAAAVITGWRMTLMGVANVLLAVSILFVCLCLVVTYSWYVGVMHMLLRHSGPKMVADGVLSQEALAELLSYGSPTPPPVAGRRSLWLSYLAGIPFGLAFLAYLGLAVSIFFR